MNEDKERVAFEAWLRSKWTDGYGFPKNADGSYAHRDAQQLWEAYQAGRSALQYQDDGWMPIECAGRRNIPYIKNRLIDIQVEDGTIFYGVMVGDVCVAKHDPQQWGSGFSLAPYKERWFGRVVRYRLHDRYRTEERE